MTSRREAYDEGVMVVQAGGQVGIEPSHQRTQHPVHEAPHAFLHSNLLMRDPGQLVRGNVGLLTTATRGTDLEHDLAGLWRRRVQVVLHLLDQLAGGNLPSAHRHSPVLAWVSCRVMGRTHREKALLNRRRRCRSRHWWSSSAPSVQWSSARAPWVVPSTTSLRSPGTRCSCGRTGPTSALIANVQLGPGGGVTGRRWASEGWSRRCPEAATASCRLSR